MVYYMRWRTSKANHESCVKMPRAAKEAVVSIDLTWAHMFEPDTGFYGASKGGIVALNLRWMGMTRKMIYVE